MNSSIKSPREEAEWLLEQHQGSVKECFHFLTQQFMIIQGRNQLLLTLSTVSLTITGFSGPTIARSNPLSLTLLTSGLLFMVSATVLLLGTGMRLKWVSQFDGETPLDVLTQIIEYRDQKSGTYQWQLRAMIVGLCCYVGSLVAFFLN
jgi:hypothetical protein